jgi:hypothetical protein
MEIIILQAQNSEAWVMVRQNFNLFDKNGNWLDCFRQWFILLMTAGLAYYLILAIKEMRRA